MYGLLAIVAFVCFFIGCYQSLILMVFCIARNKHKVACMLCCMGAFFYSSATEMFALESALLDFHKEEDETGFSKESNWLV